MDMMEEMMEYTLGRMNKEEKEDMMGKMMEKFFAGMTAEDKQKMMGKMMPKMMEGVDMMDMMSGMMPHWIKIMPEVMPRCLKMMFSKVPNETRIDFVLKIVTILVEQGSVGMSDEEKKDFLAKVVEKVKT